MEDKMINKLSIGSTPCEKSLESILTKYKSPYLVRKTMQRINYTKKYFQMVLTTKGPTNMKKALLELVKKDQLDKWATSNQKCDIPLDVFTHTNTVLTTHHRKTLAHINK
jgi:hypothetical protein